MPQKVEELGSDTEVNEEDDPDAGAVPEPPPPGTGEDGSVQDPDAGEGAEGGIAKDPRAALQGDYLLRFDNVSSVEDDDLGTVKTVTITYGVARLVLEDDTLTATEWLCDGTIEQSADRGSVNTSYVSDGVWNAFAPVKREVTVDFEAGTWETTPGTRRQGFRGEELPTNPSQMPEAYVDHDVDGRHGITTRVEVETAVLLQSTCEFYLASYATTRYYDGALDTDGRPSFAKIEVVGPNGSDAHAYDADRVQGAYQCSTSRVNNPPKATTDRDEVRLSRVEGRWLDASDDPKPCPGQGTFAQVFD